MKRYNTSSGMVIAKMMGATVCVMFLFGYSSAQAVLRAPAKVPEVTPVQPIPEDTAPNISRNIEDRGTPVTPPTVDAPEGVGEEYIQDRTDDSEGAGKVIEQQPVSTPGYGIGAGIVALFVILIAGVATWRVSRKSE